MSRSANAILSRNNLLSNIGSIRNYLPNTPILAAIKGNAYGHGIKETALIIANDVDMLGVASIEEAMIVRKVLPTTKILLMAGVFNEDELLIVSNEKLNMVLHNYEQLMWLKNHKTQLKKIDVWMKVDTGMGRLGFNENIVEIFNMIRNIRCVNEIILMSHLACSEIEDHPLNQSQLGLFNQLCQTIGCMGSILNSGGIVNFPDHKYNFVRTGIMMYGYFPCPNKPSDMLTLKPVMTLQSQLISVKYYRKGSNIGYCGDSTCEKDMLVGAASIGYADGYPRDIMNGAPVLVRGRICKIFGKVSMDIITIDLTNYTDAKIGDEVVLWGPNLPVENLFQYTQQISYTMFTGIQNRIKRIWVD